VYLATRLKSRAVRWLLRQVSRSNYRHARGRVGWVAERLGNHEELVSLPVHPEGPGERLIQPPTASLILTCSERSCLAAATVRMAVFVVGFCLAVVVVHTNRC